MTKRNISNEMVTQARKNDRLFSALVNTNGLESRSMEANDTSHNLQCHQALTRVTIRIIIFSRTWLALHLLTITKVTVYWGVVAYIIGGRILQDDLQSF